MTIKELIKKIEEKNNSNVICYLTNDNTCFNGQIAADTYPMLFEILEDIGKTSRIDLFLFSRGGDVIAPWKFVNLMREYTDEFNVLIPYHANSAATLICLGANKLYMTKLADIGPIDPTLTTPFNPLIDCAKTNVVGNTLGVSVEDVISYHELAKNILNLKSENSVLKTFEMLSENVNPIALGSIYRSYNQIRSLAHKLLELHLDAEKDVIMINRIIENLTEKLYNHRHMIVRSEAEKIFNKNIIQRPDEELENLIMGLYNEYVKEMHLHEDKRPANYVGANEKIIIPSTILESHNIKFSNKTELEGSAIKENGDYTIYTRLKGWEKETNMEKSKELLEYYGLKSSSSVTHKEENIVVNNSKSDADEIIHQKVESVKSDFKSKKTEMPN